MNERNMTKSKREIEALVRKAKERDPNAFSELIRFYTKELYRVAVAILMNDEDAADAIQDTILTCWEKIGTLKENAYFKTWITRILINKCYDLREQHMNEEPYMNNQEPTVPLDSNLEFKEMLSVLDEKYRIPMLLFYGQGYKIKEIAGMLHIPQSTIQTRLDRGREKLAAYYGLERK